MKTLLLIFTLSFFYTISYTQTPAGGSTPKDVVEIRIPNFADPKIKMFYQAYSEHLIKCIQAIRQKDESKATALFKDPGEELVTKEKTLAMDLSKNPVEKQKYMQLAAEVYPYIKELERSAYYQKLYGKKEK